MNLKHFILLFIVALFVSPANATEFQMNWDMNMLENNIHNGTQINATQFFQNGNLVIDTSTSFTDTNATTECSSGEYLDGSGSCVNVNNTIDAQDIIYNISQTSYANALNVSMTDFVNAMDVIYNTTMTTYADLHCALTGCTMSGDIDMSDNNILNVANYTGDKINVTCCVYLGTIQATDGNSISVQPTGDIDDYFSFSTPAHRPTIKRQGGKFIYFDSSNVYDVGISFRDDATYSGTLNYEKDTHKMTLLGKASPVAIKTNSEYLNYFLFETTNHQPELSAYNTSYLKIADNLTVEGDLKVETLTNGSILYITEDGLITQNNSNLFYDDSNGGSLALGDNSDMRNIFQAVKSEGITDVDNVKALIAVRNSETTNNNWVGIAFQTHDTTGDVFSVGRIMALVTSHADDAVSGDLVFDTREAATRTEKMRILANGSIGIGTSSPDGLLHINGSIKAQDWTNVTITESQVSDADWWDADGDITADEISESKIAFSTACAAGNHYYLNGNDLACEANTVDTTVSNCSVSNSCADILYETELDSLAELDTQVGITGTADATTFWRGDNSWVTPTDTNTNANTICAGSTTYLDGEGNCDDISSVYALSGYGDNWNKTYADTLYAAIGYGDDWNKTYADTLYTSNTGTVTSIATTAPISGGTITTTGTISLTACSDTEIYKYNSTSSAWECEADGGAGETYYAGPGLELNATNYFNISLAYAMPQGCNDGEIAEYNTTSGGWDCAVDNSAASGMASWVLASSDTAGSESITDGETVTFADDNKYLNATRSTNTVTYSIYETALNATISDLDTDTTYTFAKDLVGTSPVTINGGTNVDNIIYGVDADVTIAVTLLKDLVAGDGLNGGANDVLVGADADVTFTFDCSETVSTGIQCSGEDLQLNTTYTGTLYQPLEATLTDIADGTINENLVNTANPWADNEVSDTLTVTGYMQDEDINSYSEIQAWVTDATLVKAGTLTDTKICIYDAANSLINCTHTDADSGDVTTVGTPVDNQVGIWTGDGTLEGVTTMTYTATTGLSLDTDNTNSASNVGLLKGIVDENVGAGTNSGIFITNNNAGGYNWAATDYPSGTGVHIYQGAAGTALSIYGANNVNTAALANFGVTDTQSGASKLIRVDIGAADQAMEGIQIVGNTANAGAISVHAAMETNFVGDFFKGSVNSVEKFAVDKDGTITTGIWGGTALTDASVSDTLTCSNLVSGSAVVDISTETNLAVGNGITKTDDTLTVVGGTAITADAGGVSVTGDSIGDTQLAYNTGQHLTSTSSPTFENVTINTCANFGSGGFWCSN